MTTRIHFNGREYASRNQMPPRERAAFDEAMQSLADRDGNGIPDVVERGEGTVVQEVTTRFILNGKTYDKIEDLPDEARRLFEYVMRQGDRNGNGTASALDGALPAMARDAGVRTSVTRDIVWDVNTTSPAGIRAPRSAAVRRIASVGVVLVILAVMYLVGRG